MLKLNKKYLSQNYSNPFNWVGSKHRYLSEFFKILPNKDNLKVLDPFVGGGDLISKLPESWKITASDNSKHLIDLHQSIIDGDITTSKILIEHNNIKISFD